MKLCYLIFFLIPLFFTAAAQGGPLQGYIVTKNGRQLTGYISDVLQVREGGVVVFINDFGSVYYIQAELIRGFVFRNGEEYVAYASMPARRGWHFLCIVEKGPGLSLYLAPEQRVSIQAGGMPLQARKQEVEEYWLLFKDKKIKRVSKAGYKGKMRRLLRKRAPELSEKIGEEGYRFRDLPAIVREYNRHSTQRRFTI